MFSALEKKWSSLSLSAKGLIFLSLPLLLQLGFGIELLTLQQEAEQEARQAVQAREISSKISLIVGEIMKMMEVSHVHDSQWGVQGYKGGFLPAYRQLLHKIQGHYGELLEQARDKPALLAMIQRSYQPFKEAMVLVDEANRDIRSGKLDDVLNTADDKSLRLQVLARDFVSQELLLVGKNEDEFAELSSKKQAAIRGEISKYVIAIIFANVIFSLILARFLVKSITSRLSIMSENAVRLAANQPLNPPLAGDDEIARLDRVFHGMANTIEDSNRRRQEIYNMITHDLRTPLTAIQGCMEMFAATMDETFSPRSKKLIAVVARNSTRTMGLVNDLLDNQKLEAGLLDLNAEIVHLEDVFETVSLDVSAWLEEYGIKIEFCQTDVVVLANFDMLRRILTNLISNAMKHSPRESTIAVDARAEGRMAEISVRDQGKGIPKHMLKAVFDRFCQVDGGDSGGASAKGSGLGLTICSDFVALHGGKIWVTSEAGRGSTFHFTIPLA